MVANPDKDAPPGRPHQTQALSEVGNNATNPPASDNHGEVERLMADTFGVLAGSIARRLHEAGLTVVPIDPTEADVERVASAIDPDAFKERRGEPGAPDRLRLREHLWRQNEGRRLDAIAKAREAWRAAVGKEG